LGVVHDLVHQSIALVNDQLARSLNVAHPTDHRMLRQPTYGLAEQFVRSDGCLRVVASNVVENVGAILLRLYGPEDPHVLRAALARSEANFASTSSFELPAPARIETRPASTFWRRKA
jgi:hypothetical protein